MTSIHTNLAAWAALDALRTVGGVLATTQKEVSTGLTIADSSDDAAIWAVSTVMRSDASGFQTVAETLSLAKATVSVARNAAESVSANLEHVKELVVAAQNDNANRDKLQADIGRRAEQIQSIVDSAQFSGVNLVDGSRTGVDVLAAINRQVDPLTAEITVDTRDIYVAAQNLSLDAGVDVVFGGSLIPTTTLTSGLGAQFNVDGFLQPGTPTPGAVAQSPETTGIDKTKVTSGVLAGDVFEFTVTNSTTGATWTAAYRVREADTALAVAAGVKNALLDAGVSATQPPTSFVTPREGELFLFVSDLADGLQFWNDTNDVYEIGFDVTRGAGGLAALSSMSVNGLAADRLGAIDDIEAMIQTTIDAAAAFGSIERRLDAQTDFIQTLADSFASGVGALVDADLEAAAAKLRALQAQQQLGVQALAIANTRPEIVLGLYA